MTQSRKVLRDGQHLNRLIYWANELSALIGESVLIRFDPQNVASAVVYYKNRYLCTANVPELSGVKISLKEWHTLQAQQRQSARATISAYREYLDRERKPQIPMALSMKEVDMLITLERLAASTEDNTPALFSSDLPTPLLLTGGNND
jgi:hypothetical protein